MSTRQKSFFDQEQKPKLPQYFKGQWNRARSGPGPTHYNRTEAPPERQIRTGPPIMPSSQTRTKLKAFQFIEGAPSVEDIRRREAEKENLPSSAIIKGTPKASRRVDRLGEQPVETPKLAQVKAFPPPSTPAARLPLADLVANAEDSRSRNASSLDVSPDEQLCWRGSQPVNTPMPRKRKRAKSSSPAPSQDEHKYEAVPKGLNTPFADPAAELWSRYTGDRGTPSTKKVAAFQHLINEASPRSSAEAGNVGGLRRWASCGGEFPTSTKKKRKTKGFFKPGNEMAGDIFDAPSSDGVFRRQPSKLAGIVQRMQDTLQPPRHNISTQMPSSSSPLPEAAPDARDDTTTHSPLQQRRARQRPAEPVAVTVEHSKIVDAIGLVAPQLSSGSSDDFGDDDFDDEMVEALEISQRRASEPPPNLPQAGVPTVVSSTAQGEPQAVIIEPPDRIEANSEDEFGMDEDDIFAADLEQAASLFDSRQETSQEEKLADAAQTTAVPAQLSVTKAAVKSVIDFTADDSEDDFGDDIDADEFAAAEVAATQQPVTSQQDARAIQRYLIKRVDEGHYTTERGHQMPEKVLLVEDEKTKLFKAITLRQAWYDTSCTPDSFVHVIGEFSSTGQCVIDDAQNMLILHPDHLISATVVADSFTCLRRAVLQDRIKATSRANAPMLYGTLLHELFQEALRANRWDTEFLTEKIEALLPAKFETILEINASCEQVAEHMRSKLPEIQAWAKVFIRAEPRSDATVRERNGRQSIMSITKLLDVEEHVWSPMYGLKGNIDATVQVTMQDDQGERVLTVPFEVKTGKNASNASHVAQTALYNLLLSNRYDVEVAYGILYYLETSDISRIPAIRNEIIHMIIKRNELACYVRDRIQLPPMLKEDFKCQKCYAQESCFLYHKLVEDGEGQLLNKKAKERYDDLVRSLKPMDQEFMKKWDTLLTKEESDMMKFRRELWTMLSTEREKLGRCFSNIILEPGSIHEEKNGQKINRFEYTFIKQKPKAGFSFTESQLIIGEPIVVSDEKGHFALANGYVTNVRRHRISVAVDRRLHNARTKLPGFDSQNNQNFAGIMEVAREGVPVSSPQEEEEPVLYRLDKDEFSNGMAAARNNLIQIMDDSVYKARELRSLIVNRRAPVFKSLNEVAPVHTQASQMSMNTDQKAAVTKVMSAKDYALVLGMPGTGKTTTIAHIIRALVARGKSVLLTSYTHTAVDNILLKIRNDNIGILRLGAAAKVHPEVRDFAILAAQQRASVEELEKTWMDPPVVATTCLTIGHPLFARRVFDYCIVDEASQITLPVCVGPIRMAKTFILVGDHYQLPPLVQNKEAMEGGLDVSLFKLLCEAHPQAVVSLEHQYRMCADVMLLSNTFIYSGRLKCGTESVASRRLHLPNLQGLQNHHQRPRQHSLAASESFCPGATSERCWLSRALSPSQPVVFINTDAISSTLETQLGPRITNLLESRLITHVTVSLLSMGLSASEIGVIAFYRSQLALLRQSLSHAHTQTQSSELAAAATGPGIAGVELHTADKFQGRDKEVVLVSCVRSNENGVVGDLLKDRRRINVALTRARSKLIILGSEKTLSSNELLRDMIVLCREKDWVLDLNSEMVDGHNFDEGVTQTARTPTAATTRAQSKKPSATSAPMQAHPEGASTRTPSPAKKRKAFGDLTSSGSTKHNALPSPKRSSQKSPSSSPQGVKKSGSGAKMKVPKNVCIAGKRGVLDGRPVLKNIYDDLA